MNGSMEEWFSITVGVKAKMFSVTTLFHIFFERIMSDAQAEHDGRVSIGGRNVTNLRFADDIDALAEKDGYQCRVDKTDDKQRQWHPEED